MKKPKKKYVSIYVFMITMFILILGCTAYSDYTYKNVGDYELVVSKNGKRAFVTAYYWSGDPADNQIVFPDTDGANAKVETIGGYTGTGVPRPFHIELNGDEVDFISENPDDYEFPVSFEDMLFEMKIGENISDFTDNLYSATAVEPYRRIGVKQADGSVIFYRVLVTVVCDPANTDYYSKDGMLYYSKDGMLKDLPYESTVKEEAETTSETDILSTEEDSQIPEEDSQVPEEDSQIPEEDSEQKTKQNTGSDILNASTVGENENVTYGIDVSKYQGDIDWAKVAATGIDFAIIRAGFRDPGSAYIGKDGYAEKNLQGATDNGIKVGVYFFSTAATIEEAQEEADWLADFLAPYSITYPVAYDCEGFEKNRQANLTQEQRTNIAMAFMNRIYDRGYTPMFYSAVENLENDAKWDTSRLQKKYKMWVAKYNQETSDYGEGPDYEGECAMWQYSCHSRIDGVYNAEVDRNVAFFGYDGVEPAK